MLDLKETTIFRANILEMLDFKCPVGGTDDDVNDSGSDTKVRETSFAFDSFRQLSTAFIPQKVAFESRFWPRQDCYLYADGTK